MSTGAELSAWCQRHDVVGFEGVFCANTLPVPFQPRDMCFLFNHSSCPSKEGGTHWLACRLRGDTADWFDSYGLPPDAKIETDLMGGDPRFKEWLQACGITKVNYNQHDIQSIASDVCGQYACYFAKHGLPSANPKAWRFLSKSNVRDNDAEIRELVRL